MEIYNPSSSDYKAYRQLIVQNGRGFASDGTYIYNSQEGEGLSSMLGQLFKVVVPVLKGGIKGAAKIAAPHLKKAAGEIVTAGSKRALEKLSNGIVKAVEKPRKRKRRRL